MRGNYGGHLHLQGFSGSSEIVRYHVSRWRAQLPLHLRYGRGLESNEPRTMTRPSSRQAMWMLLKKDEQLED